MTPNDPTTFRLSPKARALLKRLADQEGISQRALLEGLIRREAERKGLPAPPPEEQP